MMPDIFSSFDHYEHNHTFFTFSFLVVLVWNSLDSKGELMDSTHEHTEKMGIMMDYLYYAPSFQNKNIYSYNFFVLYILLFMVMTNITGLMPYTVSWSSHMIFTVSFALPCWLTLIISSMTYKPKEFFAHLLPDGAPMWLNPALVIFESISILVRPLTLSFRLAANMSAGHIVLVLMTSFLTPMLFKMSLTSSLLMFFTTFFMMFELAVSMIQAFIFFLLLSMYMNDHS
nr:TPA: ATPase F0 subunit 6 [Cirrodrilus suzukii]